MQKFIEEDFQNLGLEQAKARLETFRKENLESVRIQSSSTKLLTFLVNDMLDFAQIRSGKFRIESTNFDIREAIEEIVSI